MVEAYINGHRLNYLDQGQGLPILFIHGGYGGAMTTLSPTPPVIREILPAGSFRLVTYDRRNAGASEYVESAYTLDDLAADAAALLDHLEISKAAVVGSSAGGPIAIQLALSHPERPLALCLPNTGANLMNPEREVSRQRAELVERVKTEGARAVFESRKHRLRSPPMLDVPLENGAAARRQMALGLLASMSDDELFAYSMGEIRNFAAYIGFDFTARLHELEMPVCIIHGTADQTVPFQWGLALHQGIAESEFHPIEGGRHGILSNPEAAAVLLNWADRIRSTQTGAVSQ
jgi:3-oxoadipate enol-lactonase